MSSRFARFRRTLFYRLLQGLCLLGCLVYLFVVGGCYLDERELVQVIAEIDAVDPHWQWDHLQASRPVIPDSQNMGTAINEIVIGLRLHNMPDTMKGLPTLTWKDAYVELYSKHKIEQYDLFLQDHPNATLPAKWKEHVGRVIRMEPAPEQIEKMQQLTKYSTGRFEHLYKKTSVLMVNGQGAYTINEFLGYDVMLRVNDGETKIPIRDCLAMMAVARVYDHIDFPMAIMQRCGVVIRSKAVLERILAGGNIVSTDDLLALQQAFAREEAFPVSLEGAYRYIRAFYDHVLVEADEGRVSLSDYLDAMRSGGYPALIRQLTNWYWLDNIVRDIRPDWFLEQWARPRSWKRERIQMLKYFNELIAVSRVEEHRLPGEVDRLKLEGARMSPFMAATHGISRADYQKHFGYQGEERFIRSYLHRLVLCRCAVAAIAAERYRLEHGQWPTTWKQLTGKYLQKTPTDPFADGHPLLIKLLDDGLVIYSVGMNSKDDGGVIERGKNSLDIGFRLWNPDSRGIELKDEVQKLEATIPAKQ